jgi:poly(A) polymerase
MMTERDFATEVVERLQRAGFQALWAGGCVRDEQLGLEPADYDIATSATPDEVKQLFKRCHSFGASFGVVEVLGPRDAQGEWLKVQVATFRSDGTYTDGRRPDSVTFSSPQEDAQRRDFTINGLFFDPIRKQVIDFVDGLNDLKARVLRAIGNPFDRFREDKLRILRAVRMATRFELAIDPDTLKAAQQMAREIQVVSVERIAEELRKLLIHKHRVRGLELLHEFQLMECIFPEVTLQQYENGLELFRELANPVSFELALAAIVGQAGLAVTTAICEKLKLSNPERERITWLVAHAHTLDAALQMRPAQLYPLLVEPGIHELLELHRARYASARQTIAPVEHCRELLRAKTLEELNPVPLLTGEDLKRLGLRPGPHFKTLLQNVRDQQLNRELLTKSDAEDWVKTHTKKP